VRLSAYSAELVVELFSGVELQLGVLFQLLSQLVRPPGSL
jgi:hypothetical protein